jgi:hypothetical protein
LLDFEALPEECPATAHWLWEEARSA